MVNEIALDELMELWRSFFQDSRNRPVDKFGKDYSAPKCSTCNGKGRIIVENKTNPEKHETKSFVAKDIFTYSDYLVDAMTAHIDRERQKKAN